MAKQIFFDDFDKGYALDTSKWSPAWGKFDPDKGTQMRFTDQRVQITYPNTLQLTGVVNNSAGVDDPPFLSGMVNTRKPDKGEILFQAKGQFVVSVKAKLPRARSSWPGVWMTGTKGEWPACGEIDILEAKGWDKANYQANVHVPRLGDEKKSQQKHKQLKDAGLNFVGGIPDLTNTYNYYGVVKLNDRVDFYFNGNLWHTVKYSELDIPTPFTDPDNGWIIRLSHIIGGSFLDSGGTEPGHDQYVDATKYKSDYPSAMFVDYVRIVSLDEPGGFTPDDEAEFFITDYISHTHDAITPTPPLPPSPTPQPPTPARPEPPVVVTPSPTPAPVPKSRGERAKGDWVREEDALVFIML